jgi:hypothetical protein
MANTLTALSYDDLAPTRDYLRDVALAMGSLQRGFLPPSAHDWQHGLEVTMRGLSTQPFIVNGQEIQVVLDLVTNKVRLGETYWQLDEYSGAEIFKNFKVWLEAKNIKVELEQPEFIGKQFDPGQAKDYAGALWWANKQFQIIKARMSPGMTAPILLYPHHFDLSLVWFPYDDEDERQVSIGFSTGDETVTEPYIYLTVYPASDELKNVNLPPGAYFQQQGFTGFVLPYIQLQQSQDPEALLHSFTEQIISDVIPNNLFGKSV